MSVDWNQRNAERMREYTRTYRRRLRQRVLDQYGRRCARCGFDDERALQLDHIAGGGAAECRTHNGGRPGTWRLALRFPRRYQLLCANCNWIKRHVRGEHGGN